MDRVNIVEFWSMPGFLCVINMTITNKTVTLGCIFKKQYLGSVNIFHLCYNIITDV